VLTTCADISPNIAMTLSKQTTNQVISIWTGSGTLLEGTDKALLRACNEVAQDPNAPAWARLKAKDGLLVLPKGQCVGEETRRNDALAEACLLVNSAAARRIRSYRLINRTCSTSAWFGRGHGLAKPLMDEADYQGETAIDTRQMHGDGVAVAYLHTGDPLPQNPTHTLQALVNKEATGGSRYYALPRSEFRGAIISSTYEGNGMVRVVYQPMWTESQPTMEDVNNTGHARVRLADIAYSTAASIDITIAVAPDRSTMSKRYRFVANSHGVNSSAEVRGYLLTDRSHRLAVEYFQTHREPNAPSAVDMAEAVLRYAAPRRGMAAGRATQLVVAPIDKYPRGVLLGAGESLTHNSFNSSRLPVASSASHFLMMTIRVSATGLPASQISRLTTVPLLVARAKGPPATVNDTVLWYEEASASNTTIATTAEVNTDDATIDGGYGPTPQLLITGGTMEFTCSAQDINAVRNLQTTGDVDEMRAALVYGFASSLRQNSSAAVKLRSSQLDVDAKPGHLTQLGRRPSTASSPAAVYAAACICILLNL